MSATLLLPPRSSSDFIHKYEKTNLCGYSFSSQYLFNRGTIVENIK